MGAKDHEGFDIGLSEEEKADLESMISDFSADHASAPASSANDDLMERLRTLNDRISQMSEIVLKINKRIDAFYDIIQLLHQKSEVMNQRIDALIGHTKAGGTSRK